MKIGGTASRLLKLGQQLMSLTQQWSRQLLVRARDRYFPTHIFKIRTSDGFLSYGKNDQVAKKFWFRGGYENEERDILRQLCKAAPDGSVFFDIGANSGVFSLLAAKSNPAMQVHSFEASQFEFRKLVTMVEWNRLENIRLNNAAVSDADGYLTIYETYSGGGALNRLDGPHKEKGHFRMAVVPALTIDRYVAANAIPKIDFVKLDVEGHEMSVLRGARATLARSQPILLIECEEKRSSAASNPEKIFQFIDELAEADYHYFRSGDRAFTPRTQRSEGNLFFVPRAKQELVKKALGWN